MSARPARNCVLLPCSSALSWAVPQACLGEIVTVSDATLQPPARIEWRGESVPVVDFGPSDERPWRNPQAGTGLIAVMRGLRGPDCQFWGVALRGEGLGVSAIEDDEIQDLPETVPGRSIAAFRMHGVIYQVPDLPALQQAISKGEVLTTW